MSLCTACFSHSVSLKGDDFVLYLISSYVRWERWGVTGSLSNRATAGCLAWRVCACSYQMHCPICFEPFCVEAHLWKSLKILFIVKGYFRIAYDHTITFTVCSILCTVCKENPYYQNMQLLYPTLHLMNLIWRMSQKQFQLIFNIHPLVGLSILKTFYIGLKMQNNYTPYFQGEASLFVLQLMII